MKFFSIFYIVSIMLISIFACIKADFRDDDIPEVGLVHEMALLSRSIYEVRSIDDIPAEYNAHYFAETKEGTEVFIVSSDDDNYVAVAFRGSEEGEDWFTNFDIWLTSFGPDGSKVPNAGLVHSGFNEACFRHGLHTDIETTLRGIIADNPSYKVIFTGHSLGGAIAMMMGSYMAAKFKDDNIYLINFGQPLVGTDTFKAWTSNLENFAMWRVVYDDDTVARVPRYPYRHAGHLIQLDRSGAKLYYGQLGNSELGYSGAPFFWKYRASLLDHRMKRYIRYIENKSLPNPSQYYVNEFES